MPATMDQTVAAAPAAKVKAKAKGKAAVNPSTGASDNGKAAGGAGDKR